MKSFFKEYFNYSRAEIRGIQVLFILILIVLLSPLILDYFRKDSDNVDYSLFESQINNFEKEIAQKQKIEKKEQIKYFNFDPNTVTKSELLLLGLSTKQANTLIKYRKSGAKFFQKEDLKKVYSITSNLYEKLEPYIHIKETKNKMSEIQPPKPKIIIEEAIDNEPIALLIELNRADSIDLIKINGVGVVMARRIINYRNFLGGYYKKEQLLEVYGLKEDLFNKIEEYINIDTLQIQKLNLNVIDFKNLNKHPYITYADTKSILKFRKLMGSFSNVSQLKEYNLVNENTFNKVRPYFFIE